MQDVAGDMAKDIKNAIQQKLNELDDKFEDLADNINFGGCSHLKPSNDFPVMEWAAWTMVFLPLISIIINCIFTRKQTSKEDDGETSPVQSKSVKI